MAVFVFSLRCQLDRASAYLSLELAAWDGHSRKSEPGLEQRLLHQSVALIKKLKIQPCLLSALISGFVFVLPSTSEALPPSSLLTLPLPPSGHYTKATFSVRPSLATLLKIRNPSPLFNFRP